MHYYKGTIYQYINNFKKYFPFIIKTFKIIIIIIISIYFAKNLLQIISNNNLIKILSKLKFKIIKHTNLTKNKGGKEIKNIFKLLVQDSQNQIIKKSKIECIILYPSSRKQKKITNKKIRRKKYKGNKNGKRKFKFSNSRTI